MRGKPGATGSDIKVLSTPHTDSKFLEKKGELLLIPLVQVLVFFAQPDRRKPAANAPACPPLRLLRLLHKVQQRHALSVAAYSNVWVATYRSVKRGGIETIQPTSPASPVVVRGPDGKRSPSVIVYFVGWIACRDIERTGGLAASGEPSPVVGSRVETSSETVTRRERPLTSPILLNRRAPRVTLPQRPLNLPKNTDEWVEADQLLVQVAPGCAEL